LLAAEPSLGFIAPKTDSGEIVHPDPMCKTSNARGKVKQQRAVRQKYVFVAASKRGQKYREYFNPNSTVQLRVMGMEATVVRIAFFCWLCTYPSFVYLAVGHC
jgi:hypothetical protein